MLRGFTPGFKLRQFLDLANKPPILSRGFIATSSSWKKKMPDRPAFVPESDLTEAFLKGSGPGGQKIVRLLHGLSARPLC